LTAGRDNCSRAAWASVTLRPESSFIHATIKSSQPSCVQKTVRNSSLSAMSSSSSSPGAQINRKIDSLPPAIADKLPHVLESKEELKDDLKEAGKISLVSLRSLAAGAFGGVCAVVVGHLFDLVKVRLQTTERGVYLSALDVVRKSIARDGLRRGLYAGVSAPLVGVTPMCMLSAPIPTNKLTLGSCCVFLGLRCREGPCSPILNCRERSTIGRPNLSS
jgi:hypothetical protein